MSKTDCSTCASRRSFLASSGVAFAGLAAAPAFATLQGCGGDESSTIPPLSAPITVPLSSLNISVAGTGAFASTVGVFSSNERGAFRQMTLKGRFDI